MFLLDARPCSNHSAAAAPCLHAIRAKVAKAIVVRMAVDVAPLTVLQLYWYLLTILVNQYS